ncbi:MAG: 3-keto-5-aminohexanoate cleavage protein [Rhodopila sp.]
MTVGLLPGATWTAAGMGATKFEVAQWAMALRGHCRTGWEGNIRMDRDTLAPFNAALVARVAEMAAACRIVASAHEARAILGLPRSSRSVLPDADLP